MVIAPTLHQWDNLQAATGTRPAFDDLSSALRVDLSLEGVRFEHRQAITQVLEPVFAARDVADFEVVFQKANVAWSRYRSFARVVREDPDCPPDNPVFTMLEQPGIGSYLVPGSAASYSGAEGRAEPRHAHRRDPLRDRLQPRRDRAPVRRPNRRRSVSGSVRGTPVEDASWNGRAQRPRLILHPTTDGAPAMSTPQPGYADPVAAASPYAATLPVPYVRASLGARFVAYLLDIAFIFVFTGLLATLITVIGLVTFGLGWSLFAVLPASGILYSAITVGGSRQSTWGMRMLGLRVVAPESGARVDWLTAGVHALLFYVAISTFLLWCVDLLFGLVRSDRRLGHDLLLGLAVVRP